VIVEQKNAKNALQITEHFRRYT